MMMITVSTQLSGQVSAATPAMIIDQDYHQDDHKVDYHEADDHEVDDQVDDHDYVSI